jgi:hypothetical protein
MRGAKIDCNVKKFRCRRGKIFGANVNLALTRGIKNVPPNILTKSPDLFPPRPRRH